MSFDRDGALAATGTSHDDRVAAVLTHPYFDKPAPKSLDRNTFTIDLAGLSPADGAATLVTLTARTVACAIQHLPAPPSCWIACGGNRLNATILEAIARHVAGRRAPRRRCWLERRRHRSRSLRLSRGALAQRSAAQFADNNGGCSTDNGWCAASRAHGVLVGDRSALT